MADLSFHSEGAGQPVLILHGWTMAGFVEAHDLEPIFSLRPGYRRIYVDLPGHGSTPADGVHDLDEMFSRLAHFIEKHILPAKFLLIGSSIGGYIAQAIANRFESSVLGLLLRFPVVEPESSKRDRDGFEPVIANQDVLDQIPPSMLEKLDPIAVQTPEHIAALLPRYENLFFPASAAADSAALGAIREDPNRYRLTVPMHNSSQQFSKPTLIVTGRQDGDVGYRDAWSLVARFPRATYITMDRAGHGLPVDEVPLFQSLVMDWLVRVHETEKHVPAK